MKTPEELFNENRPLSLYARRRWGQKMFSFRDLSPADIRQMCDAALWKAAVQFDASKGFAFSTYALSCIRGEIKHAYRTELRQRRLNCLSIDACSELGIGQFDIPAPNDIEADVIALIDVQALLSRQPERTRRVLSDYQSGMSQYEVARRNGLSQPQTSRLIRSVARQYAAACGR